MSAAFLSPFSGSSINVALPSIGHYFNKPIQHLNWVATSFLLPSAIFLITAGKLADIYGQRKIFIIGIFIFSSSSLLCSFSVSIYQLIFFRALQGLGASFMFATSVSILSSISPPNKRGKVLGFNATAIYFGLLLGPTIGGIIVSSIGWQYIFIFAFIIGSFSLFFAIKFIPNLKYNSVEKLNISENVLYWVSVSLLLYGFSVASKIYGLLIILVSLILLLLFWNLERKMKNPLFNVSLFLNNKQFTYGNIASLINYASTFAIGLLLSYYLQHVKKFDAQKTGYILMIQPLMMSLFSPVFGRLSDKYNPGLIASLGMLIISTGLFFLFFINVDTSYIFVLLCLLAIGIGFAMFATPNTNSVMSSVEKKYYGIAAATLSTMRVLGQMMSMALIMIMFSIFSGNVNPTENTLLLLTTIKKCFLLLALLCIVGSYLSAHRNKK